MKILGKEVEFDFEEAENIDKTIQLDEKYSQEFKKASSLTEKCQIYKRFFDELIGEGTSKKIFGDKNNFFKITDAYQELIVEAEKVNTEIKKRTNNMNKKYERYK